jgi:F-type H+-transporting ATPase subunit epsilon
MPGKLIHLEIVTPSKVEFDDDVKSFSAPGMEGSFQVLPDHAPFVSTLQPGKVKFLQKDGIERIFAVSGGVVEVLKNKISMLAETFEAKEDIDIERAKIARDEAHKLIETEHGTALESAKADYQRAVNRLRVAGYEDT